MCARMRVCALTSSLAAMHFHALCYGASYSSRSRPAALHKAFLTPVVHTAHSCRRSSKHDEPWPNYALAYFDMFCLPT